MLPFQRFAVLLILSISSPFGLSAESISSPINIAEIVQSGDRHMGIQLLGSVSLKGNSALAELSGLAWDEDEQILFAISDRGWLLHLKPEFDDGQLSQVTLIKSLPLLDRRGKGLRRGWRDSEGLTLENSANGIQGDTSLIISFERHHRIERYHPDGSWAGTLPLPERLKKHAYRPKSNKGLEAVTLHQQYGIVTGPEYPPKGKSHYLVNANGKRWKFKPKEPNGALVALEALPNGDLILLERSYTSIFSPWVISLTRMRATDLTSGEKLPTELIARFDSGEGWLTQNMEGLTRHQGMKFFMVSDDGNKPWAQTQLVYFRILKE